MVFLVLFISIFIVCFFCSGFQAITGKMIVRKMESIDINAYQHLMDRSGDYIPIAPYNLKRFNKFIRCPNNYSDRKLKKYIQRYKVLRISTYILGTFLLACLLSLFIYVLIKVII